ncbi:MAG: hypothetical protein BGO69_18750 [Bacteroidetes bacterium 46-16]|nr:MAG: hypothetical protein BGO69_18750 [Bacteroidetes bacterium 46-16]
MFVLILLIILPVIFGIYRYAQTLRFVSVPTPYNMLQNRQLVQQFLAAMHLAVFQHPEAPDVLQIISRNIQPSGYKNEQREIMVFIADDKRILVNSHFTNSGITLVRSAGNYRKMAKGLEKWINSTIQNNNKDIDRQNNF